MSQRRGFSKSEEWNAAYYLGLEQVVTHGFQGDFDSQVALGFRLLAAAGYEAAQVQPGVPDSFRRVWEEHRNACREIAAGSFDAVRRAREALLWLQEMAPNIGTAWLNKVLSTYDAAHTGNSSCKEDGRALLPHSGTLSSQSPLSSGDGSRSRTRPSADCSTEAVQTPGLSA